MPCGQEVTHSPHLGHGRSGHHQGQSLAVGQRASGATDGSPVPVRLGGIRRTIFFIAVAAAALATAAPALAKSYRIVRAAETYRIQRDGSVLATEKLTCEFHGHFHGAYRLIPVAGTETIDQVNIAENGRPYAPGADARVGSSGSPGTYGITTNGDLWTQVAWHFDASDTTRTFIVSYRMNGFVTAFADIGNLYLQVWGDQWTVPLGALHASVIFPSAATKAELRQQVRVWGHPASVHGSVKIAGPNRVTLDATSVPPATFVEMDTTFPRRMLSARGSFAARPGNGLPQVIAREKQIFASPYGPGSGPVRAPSGGGGGGGGGAW
jgi:uncharacterized membrane protein